MEYCNLWHVYVICNRLVGVITTKIKKAGSLVPMSRPRCRWTRPHASIQSHALYHAMLPLVLRTTCIKRVGLLVVYAYYSYQIPPWHQRCGSRPQLSQVERHVWGHDLQTFLPRSTLHLGLMRLDRRYPQHFASYESHTYMYNKNHSVSVDLQMNKGLVTVLCTSKLSCGDRGTRSVMSGMR